MKSIEKTYELGSTRLVPIEPADPGDYRESPPATGSARI